MGEPITIDDPVFGQLVWDGFLHQGWAGSFPDDEFLSWGAAVRAAFPEEEQPAHSPTESQDRVDHFLSALNRATAGNDQPSEMERAVRDAARRLDEYDPGALRKAGRSEVIVRNPRDNPPTAAQRGAWRSFRENASIPEKIAAAVLETYRQQRPERLRWWNTLYDSPDQVLPDVRTTAQIRSIIDPSEFRVYGEQRRGVTVSVVFSALWSKENIEVYVRNGAVTGVGPVQEESVSSLPEPEEIESPVFGRLYRGGLLGGLHGVFHSDALRGYDRAWKTRQGFQKTPWIYDGPVRSGPPWDVITGDFHLLVDARDGQPPTPEQEAAFRSFNADPAATARQVLEAILKWYQEWRSEPVKESDGDQDGVDHNWPNACAPEDLLELFQLQSIAVLAAPTPEETAGPRQVPFPFGPKKGTMITIPPKKPGVVIALFFHWEDEHGLAVRWRNGQIEKVGDWDSAYRD
jgi:hypothetical protein